jgi:hypothetical protein
MTNVNRSCFVLGCPSSVGTTGWSTHVDHTYPDGGAPPQGPAYFPAVGGFRFGLFTVLPEHESDYPEDKEAAMVEIDTKLPGIMARMEVDDPGMHTTDTTDFEIVLSGQVVRELDDGAEVTLSPGDPVVQNGTRHRWRTRELNQPSWVSPSSAPTAPERSSICRERATRPSRGHRQGDDRQRLIWRSLEDWRSLGEMTPNPAMGVAERVRNVR